MGIAEKETKASTSKTKRIVENIFSGSTFGEEIGFESAEFDALYAIGYAHFMQANYSEALKFFQYLLLFNHFDRRAAVAAGACYFGLKNYEEALKMFGMALILEPNDPELGLQIAKALLMSGKKEEAKAVLASMKTDYKKTNNFSKINEEIQHLEEFLQ